MENKSSRTIVEEFIKYVNNGDVDKLNSYISDDIVFTDIQGRVYLEPEFMENYLQTYPDYRIHIEHILQGGDGVAVIGFTSGSHVAADIEENEILLWTAQVNKDLITTRRIYSTQRSAIES
jgi:hypothetical protein